MFKEALRPVWAEINLSNFDYNVKNIKAKMGEGREFIGVIKADGYGHGAVKLAEVLRENDVKTFAIATLHEAIELREAGAKERIICLGDKALYQTVFGDIVKDIIQVDTMAEAVTKAFYSSEENTKVLFSPSAENGISYEEQGETFKHEVNEL